MFPSMPLRAMIILLLEGMPFSRILPRPGLVRDGTRIRMDMEMEMETEMEELESRTPRLPSVPPALMWVPMGQEPMAPGTSRAASIPNSSSSSRLEGLRVSDNLIAVWA